MSRARRPVLVAVIVVLALGAAGGGFYLWRHNGMSNQPSQSTLSLAQATQRVEQYAHDVLAHMPGSPEAGTPGRTSVPCDDPTDGGPKGRVDVGDVYRITYDEPRPDNPEVFNRLHDYWTGQGYQVLRASHGAGWSASRTPTTASA